MSADEIDPGRIGLRAVKMPDDEAFLKRLYFDRRSDLAFLPEEMRNNLLEMQWAAREQHTRTEFPDAVRRVVTLDGEDVGELIVDYRDDEIFGVDICVTSELRNLGIGGYLMNELKKEAELAGHGFRYHVDLGNPAQHLYERLGFSITGTSDTNIEMEWRAEQNERDSRTR